MTSSTLVPEQAFKLVLRSVAMSIAVVTARSGSRRNGLAATSICSVCAAPPTMLACINRGASAEPLIACSGAFAINFLSEQQHAIARRFSQPKLAADLRFSDGIWVEKVTGAPILEGAAASFDCEVQERIPSGTHSLYIGRVVAAAFLDADTLLHRNGMLRRLAPVE